MKNFLDYEDAKIALLNSLVKKLFTVMRENPAAFIENYIKIQDLDSGGAIPFKLWPKQKEVIDVFHKNRLTIVLKARQLGLTWLALAYALTQMLSRKGYQVSALSKGEKEAHELVRRVRFMLRYLPQYIASEGEKTSKYVTWEGTTEKVVIHHPFGEDSVFMSFSASPDSGRTFTSSLVIIDEWAFQEYAEEIWTAAYPTINRPTGGKVIGLSTGKRGSFFEKVWNEACAGMNGFKPVFLSWKSDPRRDAEWYENTKANLPNAYKVEYPSTPEDAFTVGYGAFFPEWNPDVHIINDPTWYPPRECQIYGAYDAGYGSFACFKWYAVFPNGQAVCYREYYPHHVTDAEQAEMIKKLSTDPYGNPEEIIEIRADPSCWNKQSGIGKSTAEVFAEHGIYMLPADNDLKNGWRRLHQYLKPFQRDDGSFDALLKFTINCKNTIRTYPSCEQDKNNPEDISKRSEHHAQDCDRYFVMSRPEIVDGKAILAGGYTSRNYTREDLVDEDDEEGSKFTFFGYN